MKFRGLVNVRKFLAFLTGDNLIIRFRYWNMSFIFTNAIVI